MAIPTVTSVSPASGPTRGGGVVSVVGTNFRLPDVQPLTGYLGGPAPLSVRVEIGGEVCPEAQAASSRLILATVPEWRGVPTALPAKLNVVVRNVSAAGVPIPTEVGTLVEGYTVKHPELPEMCYLQRAVLELMNLFKRHVIGNVHVTVRKDYVADPTKIERLLATVPVVHLIGPQTPLNRFCSVNREQAEADPTVANGYLRRAAPVTEDVAFEVQAWARTQREIFSIGHAMMMLFRDVVLLRVYNDPAAPASGYKEYEVGVPFYGHPTYNTTPNPDDLSSLRAQVEIKGVHMDDEAGTIVERGWEITANDGEPTLDPQALTP